MNDPQRTGFDFYAVSPSGIEMVVHVELVDVAHIDALIAAAADADKRLAGRGFKRSERLSQQRFGGGGGGNKRQEDTAPEDIEVPEHCGQPMRFIKGGERKDGTAYQPRFVCRAEAQCADKDGQGRPFASWKMHKKEAASERGPARAESGAERPSAAATKRVNWPSFFQWAATQGMNNMTEITDERVRLGVEKGWGPVMEWTEAQADELRAVLLADPEHYTRAKAGVRA